MADSGPGPAAARLSPPPEMPRAAIEPRDRPIITTTPSPAAVHPHITQPQRVDRCPQPLPAVTDAAPTLKKVKTNDDTLEASGPGDTQMQDAQGVASRDSAQELEHSAALAVLDDGVKESDAASGRSAWCMSLGEL